MRGALAPKVSLDQHRVPPELSNLVQNGIREHPDMTLQARAYLNWIKQLRSMKALSRGDYIEGWKFILYLEEIQNIENMKQYTLEDQSLTLSKYRQNHVVIKVPGLMEKRPSVIANDQIILKRKEKLTKTRVTFVGENYVTACVNAK